MICNLKCEKTCQLCFRNKKNVVKCFFLIANFANMPSGRLEKSC